MVQVGQREVGEEQEHGCNRNRHDPEDCIPDGIEKNQQQDRARGQGNKQK
jgi:hypothetical protein